MDWIGGVTGCRGLAGGAPGGGWGKQDPPQLTLVDRRPFLEDKIFEFYVHPQAVTCSRRQSPIVSLPRFASQVKGPVMSINNARVNANRI